MLLDAAPDAQSPRDDTQANLPSSALCCLQLAEQAGIPLQRPQGALLTRLEATQASDTFSCFFEVDGEKEPHMATTSLLVTADEPDVSTDLFTLINESGVPSAAAARCLCEHEQCTQPLKPDLGCFPARHIQCQAPGQAQSRYGAVQSARALAVWQRVCWCCIGSHRPRLLSVDMSL